ncbi:MAG: GGDEF domain-containing protein [Nitrospinota bacterium]
MIRSLSDQDGLTRILNRASMMRQFDGLLSRAKRYSEKMAVAMVDIDHFKSMNDTYGHQAGDAILRDLAQFLRKYIRQSDVVGRYGGEEFTLFSLKPTPKRRWPPWTSFGWNSGKGTTPCRAAVSPPSSSAAALPNFPEAGRIASPSSPRPTAPYTPQRKGAATAFRSPPPDRQAP